MAYRGSLTSCITYVGDAFAVRDIPALGIIHHPRAKYYSVVTQDELASPEYQPDTGDVRLVWYGTRKELRMFLLHPQADLFQEKLREPQTNDREDGEQPGSDAAAGPTTPDKHETGGHV